LAYWNLKDRKCIKSDQSVHEGKAVLAVKFYSHEQILSADISGCVYLIHFKSYLVYTKVHSVFLLKNPKCAFCDIQIYAYK